MFGIQSQRGGGGAQYPNSAVLWIDQFTIVAGTGPLVPVIYSAQFYQLLVHETSAANGDAIQAQFSIAAGTYTISILGFQGTAYGILDIYIDGSVVISGQDWYGGGGFNTIQSAGSIVLSAGVHTFKIVVNGKNGSSSGYLFDLTRVLINIP